MIKNLAIGGGSNRLLLVFAVVLGVLSAVLIGVYLSNAGGSTSTSSAGDTVPVVVAAHDIPAMTRITEDMVSVNKLPASAVLTYAFQATQSVVGQVTQVPLVSGEQIIPAKVTATGEALAQFGSNPPLSLVVPQGMRAFSIYVNKVGAVGGLLRAGDHVDVVLSNTVKSPDGQTTTSTACYVGQDVEVLAVAQAIKTSGAQGEAGALASTGTDPEATSATLAVTPDQVWWLAAAQENISQSGVGRQLWVSLRPFGEKAQANSLPVCHLTPGS